MTNLPREEFSASQIATLYRAKWEVELLFRELKSRYSLEEFNTSKEHIVKIQITAALLTLMVSRAVLRPFGSPVLRGTTPVGPRFDPRALQSL
jgi:IS4 transposase